MIVVDSGAIPVAGGIDTLVRELKYLLVPNRVDSARAWLEAVCLPDGAHPRNRVISVYYDTPGMLSLYEKINSDYLKTKIRVRWYETPGEREPTAPVFLEAKLRIGDRREKVRIRLEEGAAWIRTCPLDDDQLRALPFRLRAHGVDVPSALAPMFAIGYERTRFMEPRSGARISLDWNIGVPGVNPRLFAHAPAGRVPGAVLEVKVLAPSLPATLTPVERFGCLKVSFSKYIACYQLITRAHF